MSRSALFALMFALFARPALGSPREIRLSFMEQAATSVGIAWTASSTEAEVRYGTAAGKLNKTQSGKSTELGAPLGTVSEVTLKGLSAATTYHYRVGGPKGGWSKEHRFRTAPLDHPHCAKQRFVVIGDSRAQDSTKAVSDTWVLLLKATVQRKPLFLLHTGDIVEDGADPAQWPRHLAATAPFSATLPIMYALGNHDDGPVHGDGANYNRVFHLPRGAKALGGSGTEDHYFFLSGNAIFVSLSTQSFDTGSPKFKAQADWLDRVLAKHPKRWRIVALHHPIYTEHLFYNHEPDEQGQNAALVPVLNKHHVDIVFQGHNHFYERWAPSSCKDGASKRTCPTPGFDKGTVFITTGGGGAMPHFFAGGTSRVRPAASGAHHFVVVDIVNHTLKLRAIDASGATIDKLTIRKPVPRPDPCAGRRRR